MNRYCPECHSKNCKVEFNTLLNSIYCTQCVTKFEYPKSSRHLVGLVFSTVSFLAAVILFFSQNVIIALGFIVIAMLLALYLAVYHSSLKVGGLKGVRKRIREKRS